MSEKKKKKTPRSPRRKVAFAFVANVVFWTALVALLEGWGALHVDLPGSFFERNARVNHTWPQSKARVQRLYTQLSGGKIEPWMQTFNAQCWLEDYDVSKEKPENTYRVFYVGDSFVEGAVPPAASLPSLVEQDLNTALEPHGQRVEVINTGTPSYSPSVEYVLIRYVLSEYSPDLVVLCVDMTDEYDDWKYSFTAVKDRHGKLWGIPPRSIHDAVFVDTAKGTVEATWRTNLHLLLFEHSYFYNYLRLEFFPLPNAESSQAPESGAGVYQRWGWCREEWDAQTETHARRTLGYVRDIARYCKAQGIKLLVTGVPHYSQYPSPDGAAPWSARPHRELERVAREEGVGSLQAHAALAPKISGSAQDEWYHPGDMHFNAKGNRLWADAHLAALRDPAGGLLPDELYPLLGN